MPSTTTRHSHEDALSDAEFEELLNGAKVLKPMWNLEAMMYVLVGGRLGLRVGEIAHMTREWVNFETGMIEIPSTDSCRKGEDGGPCGYCRRQARRQVATDPERDYQEVLEAYWQPKTDAGARAVPFDHSERITNILRAFFDRWVQTPVSVNTVRRRVYQALEASTLPTSIHTYPHALRSSAAIHHAYNGLGVGPLQAMLGWEKLATADKYVRLSGGQTQRALRDLYT